MSCQCVSITNSTVFAVKGIRPHSHQAKAKNIEEQAANIKRISDKHQINCSLSLSL